MKTFAEMLPTATAEMREFVEAYVAHEDHRLCDKYGYQMQGGLKLMRATPPAKEPVSVEGSFGDDPDDHAFAITWDKPLPFNPGDRVRVVKIEKVQQ